MREVTDTQEQADQVGWPLLMCLWGKFKGRHIRSAIWSGNLPDSSLQFTESKD